MKLFEKWHRKIRSLATGVGLVAMLGLAGPATAQVSDAGGLAELMRHDYLHRDMVIFAQGLDLDEGQRMILENLYQDYRDSFDSGWMDVQTRISNMEDEIRNARSEREVLQMVLAPFEEWRDEKEQLKEEFEENLKIVLNSDQLAKWPAFERRLLREKAADRGRLAGESTNLFHIVRDLGLDSRTEREIQSLLDEYDLDLHEALTERQNQIERAQARFLATLTDPNFDAALQAQRRQVDARVKVRNVNDRYIDKIKDALPEDKATEFFRMAMSRGYPRVYRAMPVERLFDQAMNLEDLDSESRSELESLRAEYDDEMASRNETLLAQLRDFEPKSLLNRKEIVIGRRVGEDVERVSDPTTDAFRERQTRAEAYVEKIRDILTEEQFASLPGARRWLEGQRAPREAVTQPGQRPGAQRPGRPAAQTPGRGQEQQGRDSGGPGTGSSENREREKERDKRGERGGSRR